MTQDKMYVYFRIDDVFEYNERLKLLIDLFMKEKIPINLQIIPNKLNCSKYINDIKDIYNKLITIGQHGFSHIDYGDKYSYEFGLNRTYEQQYNDIYKGYNILNNEFKSNFYHVFTPPYNSFDENTLIACDKLRFKVFSQGLNNYIKKYGFKDISPQINIFDYNKKTLKNSNELKFEFDRKNFNTSIVGILIHPSGFDYDTLQIFIEHIKNQKNVEFVTFKDLFEIIQ